MLEDLLPEWIPLGLLGRVKRIDVHLGNLGELPVRQVGLEPALPVPEPLPRREVRGGPVRETLARRLVAVQRRGGVCKGKSLVGEKKR